MSNGKTRAGLYGVVGGYLLYTAYGLFRGLGDPETHMSPVLQIFFVVFFAAVGVVLVAVAVRMWRRVSREESEQLEEYRARVRAEEAGADVPDQAAENGDAPEGESADE